MSRFRRWDMHTDDLNTRLGLGLVVAIAMLLLLLLIQLLLPWLLVAAGGGAGWYVWRRHRRFQQQLYQCFYDCLRMQEGRISALDFAMAAHITGPQARAFLDARARDFFAEFEPTAHGDILYTFRTTPKPLKKLPF